MRAGSAPSPTREVVLGGLLARVYHWLGIPFEYTPLISLPFLFVGAYFLYNGPAGSASSCRAYTS